MFPQAQSEPEHGRYSPDDPYTTDLGLSICVSMFELRKAGGWDLFREQNKVKHVWND